MFLIALSIPWIIEIGSLRLSIYRFLLCLAVVPCICLWLTGRAGRIRIVDLLVISFVSWKGLTLILLHGPQQAMQPVGISFVETLGAYFLPRCFIRNADDFRTMVKLLFIVVASMVPLGLLETATGFPATQHLFRLVLPTYPDTDMGWRSGLFRAQGAFEHPILFGVVCSTAFILTFLVLGYQRSLAEKGAKAGIVVLATGLAVSSGPLLGIALQCLLLGWKRCADAIGLRTMWSLTLAGVLAYAVASLTLHRSVIEIVIARLTFDPMSYWSRNLIWEYGWSSVSNHPVLGTGLGRWDRPQWMAESIDNFWLGTAVIHGLPALLLICGTVLAALMTVGLKRGLDERHREYRAAYLITIISTCLVGQTVHLWDAAFVLFVFLLGSGIWFLDAAPSDCPSESTRPARNSRSPGRTGHIPSNEKAPPRKGLLP
ncbi:O-antigen ligase family protein [Sinorhizobium sp. BG8]|uniref:O-antigen ligase family protein n=1 Tax=Sinorhizobium sp. BG8 TaxID=2613773 RepID=UPI00193D5C1D|nr:O-antigen ligase family protein [Sinorhizobium sp. BG8]QRM53201.1 O-antigen ligase domain-containing protein [Sinorhizobium sp. BG8]